MTHPQPYLPSNEALYRALQNPELRMHDYSIIWELPSGVVGAWAYDTQEQMDEAVAAIRRSHPTARVWCAGRELPTGDNR